MRRAFVLAPEAAQDLVRIWWFIKENASLGIANKVEASIRQKILLLAGQPGAGHWRRDLTDEQVKFFPAYSFLIVYRPESNPLQVVAILDGRRDLELLLRERLVRED